MSLLGLICWLSPGVVQATPPWIPVDATPFGKEQAIWLALDEQTAIEFFDTELGDALHFLSDQHEINIVLDTAFVEEQGIGSNTPVNATLKGISLRSALNLILSELELTFIVEYEVLRVTTEEQLDYMPVTRAYDVSSLLDEEKDARTIVKMMHATRMPRRQSRAQRNNDFPIFAYKQLIVARTTHRGHRHLEELLRTLDAGLGGHSDARQELEIGQRHPDHGRHQRTVGEAKDRTDARQDRP